MQSSSLSLPDDSDSDSEPDSDDSSPIPMAGAMAAGAGAAAASPSTCSAGRVVGTSRHSSSLGTMWKEEVAEGATSFRKAATEGRMELVPASPTAGAGAGAGARTVACCGAPLSLARLGVQAWLTIDSLDGKQSLALQSAVGAHSA